MFLSKSNSNCNLTKIKEEFEELCSIKNADDLDKLMQAMKTTVDKAQGYFNSTFKVMIHFILFFYFY